jgi:GH15 family glucan-1,4-alpha-glucosidase
VRIGNAAWDQFQLDVYGETMSCLYTARKMGLGQVAEAWEMLRALIENLERLWQRPDEGIWEVRGGGLRHFTHSKVEAWVAVDRTIRLTEEFGMGGPEAKHRLPHLHTLRERIHEDVCDRAWNEGMGAFTQSYGSEALDASVLTIPLVGFLPADDPRMVSTVRAVEKNLLRGGFVRRYSRELGLDGLPGDESPFLACSFWLADNYALQGRMTEAEELFERLLSIRNHLGLLAEEYDPIAGRQIGNFPQGFSHLALIYTAGIIENIGIGRWPEASAAGMCASGRLRLGRTMPGHPQSTYAPSDGPASCFCVMDLHSLLQDIFYIKCSQCTVPRNPEPEGDRADFEDVSDVLVDTAKGMAVGGVPGQSSQGNREIVLNHC